MLVVLYCTMQLLIIFLFLFHYFPGWRRHIRWFGRTSWRSIGCRTRITWWACGRWYGMIILSRCINNLLALICFSFAWWTRSTWWPIWRWRRRWYRVTVLIILLKLFPRPQQLFLLLVFVFLFCWLRIFSWSRNQMM